MCISPPIIDSLSWQESGSNVCLARARDIVFLFCVFVYLSQRRCVADSPLPARPDGGPAAKEFWTGSRRRLQARHGQPLPQQTNYRRQQHGSSSQAPASASRSSRFGQVTADVDCCPWQFS